MAVNDSLTVESWLSRQYRSSMFARFRDFENGTVVHWVFLRNRAFVEKRVIRKNDANAVKHKDITLYHIHTWYFFFSFSGRQRRETSVRRKRKKKKRRRKTKMMAAEEGEGCVCVKPRGISSETRHRRGRELTMAGGAHASWATSTRGALDTRRVSTRPRAVGGNGNVGVVLKRKRPMLIWTRAVRRSLENKPYASTTVYPFTGVDNRRGMHRGTNAPDDRPRRTCATVKVH